MSETTEIFPLWWSTENLINVSSSLFFLSFRLQEIIGVNGAKAKVEVLKMMFFFSKLLLVDGL